jgi:hypothetical protein
MSATFLRQIHTSWREACHAPGCSGLKAQEVGFVLGAADFLLALVYGSRTMARSVVCLPAIPLETDAALVVDVGDRPG